MVTIFDGYNRDGTVNFQEVEAIRFEDLPRKGLGVDFTEIGLNQPVICKASSFVDLNVTSIYMGNIAKRIDELGCHAVWVEASPESPGDERKIILTFRK